MKKIFLSSINKAINAYLNLDPEAREHLSRLQNKRIAILLNPFNYLFACHFTATGVRIDEAENAVYETKIIGTPWQLAGAFFSKNTRQQFFAEDVQIEGDAEFAGEVIALFDELQIDWQEPLSKLIGDVPSHHLSRAFNSAREWFFNTENLVRQDISDYLHEEKNCLPNKIALNDFFNEIDLLRMDVDRIESKINFLKNEIEKGYTT